VVPFKQNMLLPTIFIRLLVALDCKLHLNIRYLAFEILLHTNTFHISLATLVMMLTHLPFIHHNPSCDGYIYMMV